MLPTVSTKSQVGTSSAQRRSSARRPKKMPKQAAATTSPIEMRLRASFMGLPMIPNCIGMKYFA